MVVVSSVVLKFRNSNLTTWATASSNVRKIFYVILLDWLRKKVIGKVQITEPDAADWGWYSYLSWNGRDYLIGASVHYEKGEDPNSELERVFQVDKQRSLIERILGKEKMSKDDPCLLFFKSIFEVDPDFKEIEVE